MSQPDPRLARCLAWLGPRRPSAGRLRAMVVAMREAGLGPATINRHLSALRKHHLDLAVPWQREPRGRTRVLTPTEVSLLRAACLSRCPRVAALVGFLHETGMRVGEALALREEDVGAGWARVRDSKNGDPRSVPLSREALRCWQQGFRGLSQSRLNHLFRAARDEVDTLRGDPEVVPHCLRHGLATRLVEQGVSLPVVGAWLGHRSPSSTYRYCHPGRAGLENALTQLEQGKS